MDLLAFSFAAPLRVCAELNVFVVVFGPLFNTCMVVYMFVYLSSCDNATFIGMSESMEGCKVEEGWSLLMALEVPSHMVHTIMGRWKRESRGASSRVSKGFKLADEYMTRVYASNVPVGVLADLNECASKNGRKDVSDSFWENL